MTLAADLTSTTTSTLVAACQACTRLVPAILVACRVHMRLVRLTTSEVPVVGQDPRRHGAPLLFLTIFLIFLAAKYKSFENSIFLFILRDLKESINGHRTLQSDVTFAGDTFSYFFLYRNMTLFCKIC
jgi:hypothetical protein